MPSDGSQKWRICRVPRIGPAASSDERRSTSRSSSRAASATRCADPDPTPDCRPEHRLGRTERRAARPRPSGSGRSRPIARSGSGPVSVAASGHRSRPCSGSSCAGTSSRSPTTSARSTRRRSASIDDLQQQVDRLEAEVEALRAERAMRVGSRPAPGAVRAGRGGDLHRPARRRAAGARPRGRPRRASRSSGIRGRACSRRRSCGGCSISKRPTGSRSTSSSPRSSPRTSSVTRDKRVWLVHQFRQAYELDRTELGQFGESAEDRALRRKVQDLDRIALGGGDPALLDLEKRRRPARALDRARVRGAPAPAARARVSLRRLRRLRALGQPARPREADRPAARGRSARYRRSRSSSRETGRIAQRLEALARERGLDGRARFAGRVGRGRAARSFGRCLAVFYASAAERGEMTESLPPPGEIRRRIEETYRTESRRVFASLVRLVRDFDLAEEALHEAFAAAVERWAARGRPGQPAGVAGVHRAVQGGRRPPPPRPVRRPPAGTRRPAVGGRRGQRRPGRRGDRGRPAAAHLHLLPPGHRPRRCRCRSPSARCAG